MKKVLLFAIAAAIFQGCDQTSVQTNADKPRDGVFIHITHGHDNPHRVLMPLSMARMMADDKDVLIYLDIDAVKLVIEGAEDIRHETFPSLKTMLQELIEKNIGIYACPGCLKAAGLSPDDLIEGVQIAQKDKFFNFTEGRILALDY